MIRNCLTRDLAMGDLSRWPVESWTVKDQSLYYEKGVNNSRLLQVYSSELVAFRSNWIYIRHWYLGQAIEMRSSLVHPGNILAK